MSKEILIFIESNTSGTGAIFIKEAIKQNFKPILLASNPLLYKFIDNDIEVVKTNTLDEENIINVCNNYVVDGKKIAGVMSSSEYYIYIAAKIASRLNLPSSIPDSIENCRNKYVQAKKLKESGVGVPNFFIASTLDEAVEYGKNLGLPVVVKPVQGSGSFGVKLCNSIDEIKKHSIFLLNKKENERGISIDNRILIEEFVVGDEYSVEVFNNEVIGITKKHLSPLPNFIETGHDFPARLSLEKKEYINNCVLKTIGVLNLKWGANHIELRIDNNGTIRIIEVNPRLAGGYIPEIVRFAYGINLISELVKISTNQPCNIKKLTNKNASIRFIIPKEEGKLVSIQGIKELRDSSKVVDIKIYKNIGEDLRLYGDFRDRIGHLIIYDENYSTEEIDDMMQRLNVIVR